MTEQFGDSLKVIQKYWGEDTKGLKNTIIDC